MKRAPKLTDSGSLERYLQEIQRIPLLTAQEEQHLARTCRPALVTANLRFVVKIARGYRAYGVRLGDLIQEGNIGLMRAVEKFDPDRGVRLVSYAAWWIRAQIQEHMLRSHSLVRLRAMPPGQLGRDLYLDEETFDGEQSPMESLPGEGPSQDHALSAAEEQRLLQTRIHAALARLDWRERYIIEQRLMTDEPATLAEIGDSFGISHQRARQLEVRARRKLGVELVAVAAEFEWPVRGRPAWRSA